MWWFRESNRKNGIDGRPIWLMGGVWETLLEMIMEVDFTTCLV